MMLPMPYEGLVYRPPSEAGSLLLEFTTGCSWNRCRFCAMYKRPGQPPFRVRPLAYVRRYLDRIPPEALGRMWRGRIFLLSGDALAAPASHLLELLEYLRERFGEHLERVSAYGSARALRDKSLEDLRRMRELGLRLVYFGLESGDDQTLRLARKGASAAQQLEAALRAQEAGMELSVMVLLGLGGRSLSRQHAKGTARLLNRIQPRYLAALTLMLEPHCEYYEMWQRGEFQPLSPPEVLQELLWLVEDLELRDTLFRTNHASNYLPLGGHLPRDRRRILEVLRAALAGHLSLRPEFLRAL